MLKMRPRRWNPGFVHESSSLPEWLGSSGCSLCTAAHVHSPKKKTGEERRAAVQVAEVLCPWAAATSYPSKWNAVLLGRKTWESDDSSERRPLPGRLNIVISRTLQVPPRGAHHVCDSVWSAVKMLSADPFTRTVEGIFVLGGTEVYREAIQSSYCHRIYLTEIYKEFHADAFFPTFDKNTYTLIRTEEIPTHDYQRHDRWMSPVSRVRLKTLPACKTATVKINVNAFVGATVFLYFDSNISELQQSSVREHLPWSHNK
ncbi:uncharacterized protein [Montipora foliosa]|uniref:uncharacterized protein isoform X2 n=1 Tax=Montipora foliosa TaxID=591990 RepID=UPI0035F2069E